MKSYRLAGIYSCLVVVALAAALCVSGNRPVRAETPGLVAATTTAYRLAPDDIIDIAVEGHDDLKEEATILPDGTLTVPIIGSMQVAGLTVDEFTQKLKQGMSVELNQPDVTVTVHQSQPRQVSVLGTVKNPGLYDYKQGWHLLEALAASGGPIDIPAMTEATLVTGGGRTTVPIDMEKLLDGGDPSENRELAPGDVLLVQTREIESAQVQVMGEVVKPGPYPVPGDGASVVDLLADAGGPTAQAELSHAQIMHAGQTTTVDLHPLLSHLDTPAAEGRLVGGDVLLIPTTNARIAVLGEVKSPATYTIADGDTVTVASAIALAGGETSDALMTAVRLVRKGPDGNPVSMSLNLEAVLKNGASTGNPELQAGDIVYVPTRHHGRNGLEVFDGIAPLAWFINILH
jgi:polysaccharide export outer membrane protein